MLCCNLDPDKNTCSHFKSYHLSLNNSRQQRRGHDLETARTGNRAKRPTFQCSKVNDICDDSLKCITLYSR